jgi:4'-phosphopantetheinyl transferase
VNVVYVFLGSIKKFSNAAYYDKVYQGLPDVRKKKADSHRQIMDKARSVGVWRLFEEGKKALHIKDDDGLVYNFSHSGEYALVAIAKPSEIDEKKLLLGCDLEVIRPDIPEKSEDESDDKDLNEFIPSNVIFEDKVKEDKRKYLKMAKRFFTANEVEIMMTPSERKKQKAMFYRFWTLKESFMKATKQGMALDIQSFEIDFKEKEHCFKSPYLKVQPKDWTDKFYYREFKVEDLAIAICANVDLEGKNCKFKYIEF